MTAGTPLTRTRPAATSSSACAPGGDARVREDLLDAHRLSHRFRPLAAACSAASGPASSGSAAPSASRAATSGVERRQVVQAGQAEALHELEAGAVQDRPARRVRAALLHDQPLVQQAPHDVVGVDAAHPLDAATRHRLSVGDDGERLQRRGREPHAVGAHVARDERAGLRCGGELHPLAVDDEAHARGSRSATSRSPRSRSTVVRVDAADAPDLGARQRPLGHEQQRLQLQHADRAG